MSKSKELTSAELATLDSGYPVSQEESTRLSLPKFGMLSKDIVEESGKGKTKTIKVIESAGTFYTEKDLGEVDEDGKKVWTKEFIGEAVEVIIAFERKQLRKYDSSLNKFISSSVYDSKDQIIPLYLDKAVVKRGTADQLQAMFPALTQKGKQTSDLKEEKLLFVVYKDELYQFNLSQSSKWEFNNYKKALDPSKVLTMLNSKEEMFGSNAYRKVVFTNIRNVTQEEWDIVSEFQGTLKDKVASDAAYFLENANVKAIEASNNDEQYGDFANKK